MSYRQAGVMTIKAMWSSTHLLVCLEPSCDAELKVCGVLLKDGGMLEGGVLLRKSDRVRITGDVTNVHVFV